MLEILRDPVWQSIGAICALITIIASVSFYWMQHGRKELSYEIVSRTPLLSVAEELQGRFQILFDGKPVNKVHLIVLRVSNTGNTPVIATDYERQVSFKFGEGARILSSEVSEADPKSLAASVVSNESGIALQPILMNSGDSVTIKTLLSRYGGNIEVDGRIVGVKEIGQRGARSAWDVLLWCGLTLSCLSLAVVAVKSIQPLFGGTPLASRESFLGRSFPVRLLRCHVWQLGKSPKQAKGDG